MEIKNIKGIKELIRIMGDSDLTEITIEESSAKLTLKREKAPTHSVPAPAAAPLPAPGTVNATIEAPSVTISEKKSETGLHYLTAPLIGTFYSSPAPDASPFVKVGDKVTKGQVICIIEAMKLMNEIESDINGVVAEMLVENASPVEYGTKVIAIKPS